MRLSLIIYFFALLTLAPGPRVSAQEHEAAVLLLNLQKLNQLREILDRMYDGYRVVSEGYGKVKQVTSGNFRLHDLFLDGLMQVSPAVRRYRRVADIISGQLRLVSEYRSAYARFSRSGRFSEQQLAYLAGVYSRLFNDSLESLDELLLIITARQLRMSDDERLMAINRIYDDVSGKLTFLRAFNTQQNLVAIGKTSEESEIKTLKRLHGIR